MRKINQNMTENYWNFSIKQKEEAISYYRKNGVVGFHDLLNSEDLNSILNGQTICQIYFSISMLP